ncbi:uracil-DNA glycosylase [Oceanivirga miroungae]|uniref:uracil-DNA glycosylase n=1 Tax=Oceanivirga miroungae TaxID=1130046 RepID=A0A6I8M7E0_9FUSO|nr:uracil-DNA glycosylase [Oceanivirga miroungae]VWL85336.1 uracil-DNA glycosylase [Oceanivirga miroungae]
MEVILKEGIDSKYKIKDFAISPLNEDIITVGEDLIFFTKDLKLKKKLTKKIDSCDLIKYIKEENQFFASSTFYIINSNNKIYKCDSSNMKILNEVFDPNMVINSINVSLNGLVIYINNSKIYCYDTLSKKLKISKEINIEKNDVSSIYIKDEKLILKVRKYKEEKNQITVFKLEDLSVISSFQTNTNNLYLFLRGINLYLAKSDGVVEIWDLILNELYDFKKISNSRITYIENDDEWIYFGTSSGELIITTDKLDVLKRVKIFKQEIKKLVYSEDKLYALSQNGQIVPIVLIDEDDKNVVNRFMKSYNINKEYEGFFTIKRVIEIENFLKKLKLKGIRYAPSNDLIFKALETSISDKKVCILGKDPYFQPNVATGLAFEVRKKSWASVEINASLRNILKLIYYSYTNDRKEIREIRDEIDKGKFKILPPDKIFSSWEKQGVLLLNTGLTVELNNAGSHIYFWEKITKDLIKYISSKNKNITYLLWGKEAQNYEKEIQNGNIIKHNHPAICGKLDNANDFLNGESFIKTMNIINWLGEEKNE